MRPSYGVEAVLVFRVRAVDVFVVAAVHRDSPRAFSAAGIGPVAVAAWATCIWIVQFARVETDGGQ